MAPPMELSVERRAEPYLSQQYGAHWNTMLEKRGYFYLGGTDRPGTLRVPGWRPHRVLAVNQQGVPVVWENACRHHGLNLLPASDGLHFHAWEDEIICPWHGMKYQPTGEVKTTGLIPIRLDKLPEQRCPTMEIVTWQGLVFELGHEAAQARQELEASLNYVAQVAGETFDFQHYRLQVSICSPQTADAHTSVDNYLDVTHVGRHADTLLPLVDLRSYAYMPKDEPPENVVVQFMGLRDSWIKTEKLGRLYEECNIPPPHHGAVWVTTRMGFMLEYYPGVIVVSQCFPHPEKWWECVFYHDFYYHVSASVEFIDEDQRKFKKTGDEDLVWCNGATEHLRYRIARGQQYFPWGFFDPRAENFGPWYSNSARQLLGLA